MTTFNDKIHNYVIFDIIVNFIIQKLKNKHTSLQIYKLRQNNLSQFVYYSLVLREQEKKKYSAHTVYLYNNT